MARALPVEILIEDVQLGFPLQKLMECYVLSFPVRETLAASSFPAFTIVVLRMFRPRSLEKTSERNWETRGLEDGALRGAIVCNNDSWMMATKSSEGRRRTNFSLFEKMVAAFTSRLAATQMSSFCTPFYPWKMYSNEGESYEWRTLILSIFDWFKIDRGGGGKNEMDFPFAQILPYFLLLFLKTDFIK